MKRKVYVDNITAEKWNVKITFNEVYDIIVFGLWEKLPKNNLLYEEDENGDIWIFDDNADFGYFEMMCCEK